MKQIIIVCLTLMAIGCEYINPPKVGEYWMEDDPLNTDTFKVVNTERGYVIYQRQNGDKFSRTKHMFGICFHRIEYTPPAPLPRPTDGYLYHSQRVEVYGSLSNEHWVIIDTFRADGTGKRIIDLLEHKRTCAYCSNPMK